MQHIFFTMNLSPLSYVVDEFLPFCLGGGGGVLGDNLPCRGSGAYTRSNIDLVNLKTKFAKFFLLPPGTPQ